MMVHYLIDENTWVQIGRALARKGHAVSYVRDLFPAANDSRIMKAAHEEQWVVITEDKDYGHLIFGKGAISFGVIMVPLFAYKGALEQEATGLAERISGLGDTVIGTLTVMEPKRIRQRKLAQPH